jgi:uncharacterized protein YbjT (DUF2867 family)
MELRPPAIHASVHTGQRLVEHDDLRLLPVFQAFHREIVSAGADVIRPATNGMSPGGDGMGMSRVLLTGATGVLGRELCPRLLDAGHEVRATSRSPPTNDDRDIDWVEVDLADGTGVQRAVADVDVVVHAASDPQGDSEAVDVDGTNRLLSAARGVDVENFVYVSIVGIDDIPYSYYQHKHAAERAVEESSVPSTIVRSTQFYPFVASMLSMVRRLPVWPLPTAFQLQPIETGEAAEAICDHVTPEASGRVPNIGGPEVLTVRELAEAYRDACDVRWPIVRLPLPGDVAAAFRAGEATCPDRTVGVTTWRDWLESEAGIPGASSGY